MADREYAPVRLFLDTGVIIEGCFSSCGASKAVLIFTMVRANFTVVLAEAIERELQRGVARNLASLGPEEARMVAGSVTSWLDRVRVERHAMPTRDEMRLQALALLPGLRHVNDLPAVVTATRARPDWVLSTNTAHWNASVAKRAGLRIVTPLEFLRQLKPAEHT